MKFFKDAGRLRLPLWQHKTIGVHLRSSVDYDFFVVLRQTLELAWQGEGQLQVTALDPQPE